MVQEDAYAPNSVGSMDWLCDCDARLWANELHKCCHNGKVHLAELPATPPLLQDLMTDMTFRGTEFRRLIRGYNSLFAFSSLGAKVNVDLPQIGGVYTFRLNGQMVHKFVVIFILKHACLFTVWEVSPRAVASTRHDFAKCSSTMAPSPQTDGLASCQIWTERY
jgi:hypothetical protein